MAVSAATLLELDVDDMNSIGPSLLCQPGGCFILYLLFLELLVVLVVSKFLSGVMGVMNYLWTLYLWWWFMPYSTMFLPIYVLSTLDVFSLVSSCFINE